MLIGDLVGSIFLLLFVRRISTFLLDLFMSHDHFGYMVLFLWSSQPFLFDISDKKKKKIQMESRSLQLETVKFDQNEKLMFRPPDKKYSLKTRT